VSVQPDLLEDGWIEVLDGNMTGLDLFSRHYTYRQRPKGERQPSIFVGPGFKLVLVRGDAGAICAWRYAKIRKDDQTGIECCIFRREHGELASLMLREAMHLAWVRWPEERLFTFVDPRRVRPTMVRGRPVWGYCFYQAGWRFEGLSKKGLHILFCLPEWVRPNAQLHLKRNALRTVAA